jgi:acetolactate decarboxylase
METSASGRLDYVVEGQAMRHIGTVVLLLLTGWVPVSAQGLGDKADTLSQISTLDALLIGEYDGRIPFRKVMQQGDFGLGTFAALDGEMVAVDGAYYQVREDGIPTLVSKDQLTPFAAVTFFRADDVFSVTGETSCAELHAFLQDRFPSNRLLYAVKVTGFFTRLTTRSVPAQEKPFVALEKALQQQVTFNFEQVDATLVGFWLPATLADVNVAGFHFHAITADARGGGHVLDCEASDVEVEIDYTTELRVQFTDGERPHPPVTNWRRNDRLRGSWPPLLHW